MKKFISFLAITITLSFTAASVCAQCAMCTKTAQQLGEKPAAGLNSGIIYLMAAPFALIGVIGYRWWKGNQAE